MADLVLIHLPVHASWLDQCEIYFSIEQRKVVKPNDFTTLDQISKRIEPFEARYNQRAVPFDWKFGRDDLDKLCHRLDTHRQQRWPNLAELSIRFRGDFVYLTSTDFTGDPMPLCRLTYKRNAEL